MVSDRYRSSGKVSPIFPWIAGAVLVPAVVLAGIYQTVIYWVPFIYVEWLVVVGMAFALGALAYWAAKKGKCRSVVFAMFLGALIGAVGVAASHWVNFLQHRAEVVKVLERHRAAGELEMPQGADTPEGRKELVHMLYTFEEHIKTRVESGWTIGKTDKGAPLTGVMVWLIWSIEAAFLIGAAAWGARKMAIEPYDESADGWMPQSQVHRVAVSQDEAQRIARATTADELLVLPAKEAVTPFTLNYKLATAVAETEPSYLTIEQERYVVDSKGNQTTKKSILQSWVALQPIQVDELLANIEAAKNAPDPTIAPPPLESQASTESESNPASESADPRSS